MGMALRMGDGDRGDARGRSWSAVTTLQVLTGYAQAAIVRNQLASSVRLQLRTTEVPMDAFMPVLIVLGTLVLVALAGAIATVAGYDSRDGFDPRDR